MRMIYIVFDERPIDEELELGVEEVSFVDFLGIDNILWNSLDNGLMISIRWRILFLKGKK
jgi:hypothetical protein